jgi:hypothetical protein
VKKGQIAFLKSNEWLFLSFAFLLSLLTLYACLHSYTNSRFFLPLLLSSPALHPSPFPLSNFLSLLFSFLQQCRPLLLPDSLPSRPTLLPVRRTSVSVRPCPLALLLLPSR